MAHYKGFDVVSLVDFRYRKEDYVNSIHKAVSEIAKMNRIGFYLTLSSLKRKVLDFSLLYCEQVKNYTVALLFHI